MRITAIGHAGLFVETRHRTILCDPWFNPAYFAAWFPFPDNSDVDIDAISRPDYLYVSHLHHDHFDPTFLRDRVSKDSIVLLPDYPMDDLERTLADLGFRHFARTRNCEPIQLDDGLRIMIVALTAPTDGPIGDSGLAVDDGAVRIFNQNDSRPVELEPLHSFGPYQGHFLQFSGAIWYPMVYDLPEPTKRELGRSKRLNGMARAKRYIEQVNASFTFPFAGPPAFLDDDLFSFNDIDGDDSNVFPDQRVFLEYLRSAGMEHGRLIVPGSVITLDGDNCTVEHPASDAEVDAAFEHKEPYLRAYQDRQRPRIAIERASWARGEVDDLAGALKTWWEPLLRQADMTCAGVDGRILLEAGDDAIVIDFVDRRVGTWQGEPVRYRFSVDRALVESCVTRRVEDWVNELFLSCRFTAGRDGPFNEYVYNFFKSLSSDRMQHTERYYAGRTPVGELVRFDGYLVQRRCPHLRADLVRFGEVVDGVLTCTMHGWQFDLATGECINSSGRRLHTEPATDVTTTVGGDGAEGNGRAGHSSERRS
jgi:UDP-MurNAc hydroxylase